MRPDHAALQPKAHGFRRQRLDMPRHRVIGFVAVQVHRQAPRGGQFTQLPHRIGSGLHGALKMRDAADHVDTHIQRPDQIGAGVGAAIQPVLRESDQLQVDIGGDAGPHLDQRLRRAQLVVTDIDMGADRQQPLRHRQIAVAQSPLHHRLDRQQRFQLAPQGDPLQQSARHIQPGQAERQGGIHVEMRIDKRWGNQPVCRVNGAGGRGGNLRFNFDNAPGFHRNINAVALVWQAGVDDQQIQHPERPPTQLDGKASRGVCLSQHDQWRSFLMAALISRRCPRKRELSHRVGSARPLLARNRNFDKSLQDGPRNPRAATRPPEPAQSPQRG